MSSPTDHGIPGFWDFAAASPDRLAAVDHDGRLVTFGESGRRVNQLSRALRELGLRAGDRLAIVLPNRLAQLETTFAAAQIGIEQVPVNTHLTPAEIAYILADSAPSATVVDDSTAAVVAQAERLLDESTRRALDFDGDLAVLAAAQDETPPPDRSGASAMPYTSGTSGRPKGVSRAQVTGTPEEVASTPLTYLIRRFGVNPAEQVANGVHLVTSPLYHGAPGGYAKLALHLGHTVVIPSRFDAAATLRLIAEHRVTWTSLVPTMFKRLLDLPDDARSAADTSSLRWVFHGGAPCPPELKRRMLQWWGPIIYEYYASTEGGGTCIGPEEWLAHAPSVGRPWPGAEIRILDEDSQERAPGDVGQVYFRNTRPFEYHNDAAKTRGVQTADGRYITAGDLGYLDEEGYLFLAARRSDLIISGGVNVYPAEVEAVLTESARVADAAVIGIEDPEWGQRVVAVVQPADGVLIDDLADELTTLCAQRLAAFKRPKSFEFVDDLGRTPSGKIRRDDVRRRLDQASRHAG
ncbi:AMP-binding protein [Pseudofrankia asymbiotica]|uniref:Acyl-CoA synthetase n=1 Tax=Pseudofrankia asymbiotica TaxID=1834516 RepID=A0A1V2IF34_9ACTN|nr:AMP-binding protein [Pseudofrankia asymbiotica]ONH31727.1 hypothetical protein BL253_08700 [Pseudofrankia asymbiotica]